MAIRWWKDRGPLDAVTNIQQSCLTLLIFVWFISFNFKNIYLFIFRYPCGILIPPPGIKPVPPTLEAQTCNLWTTREVTPLIILKRRSLSDETVALGTMCFSDFLLWKHIRSFCSGQGLFKHTQISLKFQPWGELFNSLQTNFPYS